ncbi:MAG TPA: ANTAR domain-containing protein [bacterium]|nr:ANTAR domain-containing protein [bacterium]
MAESDARQNWPDAGPLAGGAMESLRVLIADERGLVASRLIAQLEGLGHWVIGVAEDGRATEESVARLRPDLVVIGSQLPPEGAIETTRAIITVHPTPAILLTGYVGADLVRRGQDAGVMAYLLWPADTNMLAATIRVALARFRELRQVAEQLGDSQQALRVSLIVERAKRMLVRRLDLSESEAFQYLRRQSEITEMSIGDVAANLLSAGALIFGKPEMFQCLTAIVEVLDGHGAMGPSRVA